MPRPKRDLHALADLTTIPPPTLPRSQAIALLQRAAGNNLYLLVLASGKEILAELHPRFRSTVWIKRGSYVVVDTEAMRERENKLGGEIVNVVREERAWRKMGYWPVEFGVSKVGYGEEDDDEGPKMPPQEDEDEEG